MEARRLACRLPLLQGARFLSSWPSPSPSPQPQPQPQPQIRRPRERRVGPWGVRYSNVRLLEVFGGRGLRRPVDQRSPTRGCNPLEPARSKSLMGAFGTVCVSIMGRSTIGGGQRVQYHGQKYDRGGGKLQYYGQKYDRGGRNGAVAWAKI